MKFILKTAESIYNSNCDEIEKLKKLGFTFTDADEEPPKSADDPLVAQSEKFMVSGGWYPVVTRFKISESSKIEINNLKDLMHLVIDFDRVIVEQDEITIYNGYME
jgi:hypothetical protein